MACDLFFYLIPIDLNRNPLVIHLILYVKNPRDHRPDAHHHNSEKCLSYIKGGINLRELVIVVFFQREVNRV